MSDELYGELDDGLGDRGELDEPYDPPDAPLPLKPDAFLPLP